MWKESGKFKFSHSKEKFFKGIVIMIRLEKNASHTIMKKTNILEKEIKEPNEEIPFHVLRPSM